MSAWRLTFLEHAWSRLCEHLDARMLAERLTYAHVEGYVRARRAAGIRGQSIRPDLAALKRGLELARRHGAVSRVLKDWPRVKSDPPDERQAGRLFAPADIARWLDALRHLEDTEHEASGAHGQAVVVLLTGLRAEEVRKVRASWLWWDGDVAFLRAPRKATKGRDWRDVGAPPEALEALWRAAEADPHGDPELWPGNHRRAHRNAAEAAGLARCPTLRDLRHTHSTWGLAGTGDAAAVMAAMGHTDLRTTQRYQSATLMRARSVSVSVSDTLSEARRWHSGGGTVPPHDHGLSALKVEPMTRIELVTSSLPRTEKESNRRSKHIAECTACQAIVEACIALHAEGGTAGWHSKRAVR